MSLTIGELTGFLTLDKGGFDRDVDASGSKFGAMAGGLGKAAVAGGAVAGAAIAGLAAKGLQEFSGLQSGMNEVFTLLPGMSQQAMGDMTDDVRTFSKEMGVLPNDVVPALYQSLSAGVPPDNVFSFLETANQAALGGVTDLETAVDGITSVTNAYGDQIGGAAEASDLMFTAVRLGKTDFEQLSGSLYNVIPTAASLGVGFDNITAAMASMTAQGTPTSVATTQLRQLLVEMSKDGGKASDAFKEVAGVGMKEFMEQGGNMADALEIMQQAADDNGVAINDMFGSVEAGNAALALSGDNADGYRQNLAEMADSAGATETAHAQMDQGLGRTWDRIKTHISVALGEIGERLAPTFQEFGDWIVEYMPTIVDFIVGAFETIAEGATWLQDNVGPVFEFIGDAIQTVRDLFTSSSDDINTAMGGVQEFAAEVWPQIQGVIQSAMDAVQALIDRVIKIVQGIWERWGADILKHAANVWEAIQQLIGGVLDVIQGIFEVFAGLFSGDWSRLWDGVKQIASGVWDVIVALWDALVSGITLLATVLRDTVTELWGKLWDKTKEVASAAWDSMKEAISDAIDDLIGWFRDLPGRMLDALGNLGSILKGAGRAIINGLWDGMKAGWENTKNWVGGLGDQIKNLKGPLAYDKVMLKPEAAAIMGGFQDELEAQWRDVERTLGTMTAEIPAAMSYAQLQSGGMGPQVGQSMPSELVIVDADGALIGRMEVAADQRIGATFADGTHAARVGG